MHPALREARDFLRFHSDWDDDDCRKAFKVLENLEAHFDCLDRRECYEMYESTTTVVLDSVDIDQVGNYSATGAAGMKGFPSKAS